MGKQRVSYFYDSDFQTFYFGQNHPMKPHRLAMTQHLVLGYGLHEYMECFVSGSHASGVYIAQLSSSRLQCTARPRTVPSPRTQPYECLIIALPHRVHAAPVARSPVALQSPAPLTI